MNIAVTGIPASGKTTLAKKLAQKTNYTYISVYDFAKKHKAILGQDKKRHVDIVDEKKLAKHIKKMDNIIFDGHFSHLLPVDKIILAKCDRKILRERMLKRKYSDKKIEENIEADIFEVIEDEIKEQFSQKKYTVVNTSHARYKPNLKKIIEFIKK